MNQPPILTSLLIHFSLKGWENILFELGSERDKLLNDSLLFVASFKEPDARAEVGDERDVNGELEGADSADAELQAVLHTAEERGDLRTGFSGRVNVNFCVWYAEKISCAHNH